MNITKVARDHLAKVLLGTASVPRGLFELNQYFRQFGPIHFDKHREDGLIVAVSQDFKLGKIVTSGSNEKQLDEQIKDAILTVFEVPSSYREEAGVIRVGEKKDSYALA